MVDTAEQLALTRSQYHHNWLEYVAHVESRVRQLQLVKQSTELFLLVSSYLIFYFIDCFAQILSMPLPLVR